MSEQLREIGLRVRELREINSVSADALAKTLDMTAKSYQDFEAGLVDLPISALFKIARTFKVELTELLTGKAPKLHEYCLVKKDKGVNVDRVQQYHYQSLAHNYANKKAEPFLVTVEPQPENVPVPLRAHSGQEFYYVTKGTLKVVIHKHEVIMTVGDSLFFDSGYEHGMKALNNESAQLLAIIF